MNDVPFIPGIYLRKLLDLMEEENLPTKHIVRECGIDSDAINLGYYVSNNQMQSVIRHYLKLTNKKNPGVCYGFKLDALMHGFLGYIYMFRGKPYDLIKNVISYMNVRLPAIKMDVVCDSECVSIQLNTSLVPKDLKNFVLQSYIASFYKLGSMILPKIQVYASNKLFAQFDDLHEAFQNSIVFNDQDRNELRYSIKNVLPRNSVAASVSDNIAQASDLPLLVLKLRQYLVRNNEELVSAEQVASDLGMSVRTLRRKLSEYGYSFRTIRQEMLMNTATRYLQNSTLSIERIAEKCGYSDQASFSRAFQKWQGDTPDVIRRQSRVQSSSKA